MRLAALVLAAALAVPAVASAQSFVKPMGTIDTMTTTTITLNDGTVLTGKIEIAVLSSGHMSALVLKDGAGETHKLKGWQIKEMRNEIGGMMKSLMVVSSVNKNGAWNTDWEGLLNRNESIWYEIITPGKRGKRTLLQLLNPGFDSRIRVFYNPKDDVSESVYVTKDGEQSVKLTKKTYGKEGMSDVFGDCAAATSHPAFASARFEDLAAHVIVYDQLCPK